MSEPRATEATVEEDDEEIPQIITDEFFGNVQLKVQTVIKDLREKEQYQLAAEFIRLLNVAENLQIGLKDEQVKNQELTESHVDASGRIEAAMIISQRDQDVIGKLRQEVIEAWSFSDLSKTREIEITEKLDDMRNKLEKAQMELKKFERKIEDSDISSFGKHKVTVLQEVERLTEEVRELNKRLQVQRTYADEIQKKLDDSLETNRNIYLQWDEATNETLSNKKKLEVLTQKRVELEDQLDQVTENMFHYKNQSETRNARLQERDKQLIKKRDELEKANSDNHTLKIAKTKLDESLKSCSSENNNLKHEMNQMKNFLRLKEDEFRKLTRDSEQQMKKMDGYIRKISTIEKVVTKNELDLLNQRNEIITIEKDREAIQRSNDNLKREGENLYKKNDKLMMDIEKRDEIISGLKTEKASLLENKFLADQELKLAAEREKKSKQLVKNIHSKLESVESEKSFLEKSLKELNDELAAKNQEIDKMKAEMNELNDQLMNIKYEHDLTVHQLKDVRADYQKCREREMDVKERWLLCKSQIDDANVKLTAKIEEIGNLSKKILKLEKNVRELQRDLERSEDVLKDTRDEVETFTRDNKLQKDELRENEMRFVKMKGQMDKLLRERDLIANQMLRRTDESELLEKEVSMLKMTVERSNGMYNDRLDDIKMMRNEIKSLRSQTNVLKRGLENTADMRHEVLKLHRKLNQERVKAKVLEQEMSTPTNVHRWRKLSRFDPKRMETLKKSQLLQRKSLTQAAKIMKCEEIIEALQEKIRFLERSLVAKKTCVEVQKKLMVTRSQLEVRTKRMKAAIAIRNASDVDFRSKDALIDQMQKDLNDSKALYFREKQEKHKLLEKLREMKKNPEKDETKEMFQSLGSKLKMFA